MSSSSKDDRIVICGTGRCGTTFLMMVLTFLGLDTGFTKDTYKKYFYSGCKAGLELVKSNHLKHRYTKDPKFTDNMDTILRQHPNLNIQYVIVPIRNLREAATSRVSQGPKVPGGLWNANDLTSQEQHYKNILCKYLEDMVRYDIPTIFLDFEWMTTDASYLYERISPTFPPDMVIPFPTFERAFQEALSVCAP